MEARNFDPTTNYTVNDLCLYEGYLYIFTSAHPAGEWDPLDVSMYDDAGIAMIMELITGREDYSEEAAYAETIVYDTEQIRETRYRFIFTNAADPRIDPTTTPTA